MMMRLRNVLVSILVVLFSISLFAIANGDWLRNVPARDHKMTNPYHGDPDTIAAGRRIFVEHCMHCHGENAGGNRKRPALTSLRVQEQATEGDLHWLMVNGNMRKGMPSWAKLPDQQRWQVISYIKSLSK